MADRQRFDHYEVLTRDDGSLHELGRGSMGITYKAVDTNLHVEVALKVINAATLESGSARERFASEARAAARLRHRHVASVFHLGSGGDAWFYAMEFIDGETVDALVKREGALAPRFALELALQVARALAAAQREGLVHRDIKPANLMLVTEDDEVCVKVIDFGLAKSVHAVDSDASQTVSGFVGTPHFASPEQLEEKPIDTRSDIYSLGATLWFMLTSRPPFSGNLAQVITAQLKSQPPLDQLAGAPEPVRQLLGRMLAKDPAQRPQTPAELRSELEAALAALPLASDAGGTVDGAEVVEALEDEAGRPFKDRELVANRYEIEEDRGEGAYGAVFRALDKEAQRRARLIVVSPALIEDRQALTGLEEEVVKLGDLAHPNILGVRGIEQVAAHTVLVLEWTCGFSLVELLRVRRELDTSEMLPIVKQVGEGAQFAMEHDLRRLDFALHQVAIHFPGFSSREEAQPFMRKPVSEWPEFEVKLYPLAFVAELSLSDTWAGGQTIAGNVTTAASAAHGDSGSQYVLAVCNVAYELLGGTSLAGGSASSTAGKGTVRYVPLANLSEAGNDVLKRAATDPRSVDGPAELCRQLATEGLSGARIAPAPPAPATPPPAPAAPSPAPAAPSPVPAVPSPAYQTAPPRDTAAPAEARKSPVVAIIVGLAILAACVAAFLLAPLFSKRDAALEATAETPAPAALPSIPPEPSPEQSATPSRHDQLRVQLAAAEALEQADKTGQALEAYASIAKAFPEFEISRLKMQELAGNLRAAKNIDFPSLREGLTGAGEAGVLPAILMLAENLRSVEPESAFRWYSAAAEAGNPAAHTQLGLMYSNGAGVPRNLEAAVEFFRKAAELGDSAGYTCLGECYLNGMGVTASQTRAAEFLEQGVEKGDARAMNLLGTLFHQGRGVPRDFVKARKLFEKAVAAGHEDAMGNLGVLYINGDGVERDMEKAVSLFRGGAEKGSAYSMFLWARCLESGTGVKADANAAKEWYRKAADLGHPGAMAWCRRNKVPVGS